MRVLRAAGEFPSFNDLTAPEGAAIRAENVVVDMPNEWITHRGMESTAEWVGNPITSVTMYQETLVAHSEQTGKLARYSGGAWVEYEGTYNAPAGEVMAFHEVDSALFMTTTEGLVRLDTIAGEPVAAGLPRAQIMLAEPDPMSSSGFLLEGEATSYRHHWAVVVDDGGDGRLVEGAPATRRIVTNPSGSGSSRDVRLTIPIPLGLPPDAFLRVFRANSVDESIIPTDEVRQVYEYEPNQAELAAGVVTFVDGTPDSVKGPSAYYSANTGDGVGQSNFRPVRCAGLSAYQNALLGVCATGVQRLTISLLGVSSPNGLQLNQGFRLVTGATTEIYFADTDETFPSLFKRFDDSTPALNTARTVDSICRAINSRSNGLAWAYPVNDDAANPGRFIIEARSYAVREIAFEAMGDQQSWAPAPKAKFDADLSRPSMSSTVTVTTPFPHGLQIDDQVNLVALGGAGAFSLGVKTVEVVPSPFSFEYTEAGPLDGIGGTFESLTGDVTTTTGTAENALVWGKEYEPDHWPLTNLLTVGNPLDTLLWAVPLDRYAFLGSEGGLYRLTGDPSNGFGLVDNGPWSTSSRFLGRRNVAVLGGRAYALSTEGIVSWTESSKPEPIDAPIQEEVRRLIASNRAGLEQYGYFVADELNQRLYVFVPEAPESQGATRAHIFNGRTGAWTRLTDEYPGMENGTGAPGMAPAVANGKLFIVPRRDDGVVLSTRLNVQDSDYQGPNGEPIPASVQYVPWFAGEPERQKMWTWTKVYTKSPTSSLEVCFATDWVSNETCQLLPDQDPTYNTPVMVDDPIRALAWPTIVDADHMRGKQLSVKVSHAVAQQPLRLLGVDVKHRPYGSGQ